MEGMPVKEKDVVPPTAEISLKTPHLITEYNIRMCTTPHTCVCRPQLFDDLQKGAAAVASSSNSNL